MLRKISHSRENSSDKAHKRNSSLGGNPPISGYKTSTHKRTTSRSSASSVNSNFLAEQYDRDRTAIINSCFQKVDPATGTPLNSYITHVRIIEDSRFPSSRPAINSPLENKKKRVLIVSSQSNGKGMQFHKARENSNGTFQIGRTWDLFELELIERDVEIPQGFILVMGKKYYWQTNSAKERTVFIKSLVSIFMENTGGRVPKLINWDLSMFYLDETSYQRAVISKPSGSVSPVKQRNVVHQQVSTPQQSQKQQQPAVVSSAALAAATSASSTAAAVTATATTTTSSSSAVSDPSQRRELPTADSAAIATPSASSSPKKASITSQPYSQSTTIIAAERKLQYKHVAQEPSVLTPPPDADYDQDTKNVMEEINDMLQSPLQSVDIRHRRSSYQQVEKQLDNSDGEYYEIDNYNDDMKMSPIDDDYNQPIQYPTVDPTSDKEDLYDMTNSSFQDQTEDLSFEKDDEKRYSADFNNTPQPQQESHYHLVHTIPEEQSELADLSKGDILPPKILVEDSRPKSPVAKLEETINEEVLLEVLTEVNWDVNDDSSSLLEKLHSRLADVDYQLNKNLLFLPKSLGELNPYKDLVFKECDKLDPTLSLFTMELSSVSNDIEFVESQQNGLQVRVANRKLLWKELNEILNSVSIDEKSLHELLRLPMSKTSIERMEVLLVELYAALKAIDGSKDQFVQDSEDDLSDMRALSERRHAYEKVTELFIERIVEQMSLKFKEIEKSTENTKEALTNTLVFSSLTLFCKDVSMKSYEELIDLWNEDIYQLYERKTNILLSRMRPVAVSQNSQLSQLSFNQSEQDSLYQWWYTLRIQKAPFQDSSELDPQLVSIINAIREMESVCTVYQNFVSSFFHLSSRLHFNEFVGSISPNERGFTDLQKVGPMESVRKYATNINQLVSKIIQNQLVKFFKVVYKVAANNRVDNPALLLYLECRIKDLESSDQEVLRNYLIKAYQRIQQDWSNYVDEQCVYIERAVINFKSRSLSQSVVSLPIFTRSVEKSLRATVAWLCLDENTKYDSMLYSEQAYMRIAESTVKLLLSSTNQDINTDMVQNTNMSEKLDETVTLLINTNLLLETLPLFDMDIFSVTIQETKRLFDKEKESYSEMLMNSSMPALVAFVQGAYSLIETSGGNGFVDPKQWAAYSEQNLSKILVSYTSQEVTALIGKLYNNMEAHFLSEANNKARDVLCQKLWSNIQGKVVSFYLMLYSLIEKHYKNTNIKFSKNDIIAAFDAHK